MAHPVNPLLIQLMSWPFIAADLQCNPYLNIQSHVALRPGVVSPVLLPDQHDEIKVVPDVVFHLHMLFKGNRLVVKLVSFKPWTTGKKRKEFGNNSAKTLQTAPGSLHQTTTYRK